MAFTNLFQQFYICYMLNFVGESKDHGGKSQIISLWSSYFYSSFILFIPEAWPPLSE